MNEGETFCSSDNEHKFCNKVHGDWGDSIPNDGEYCLFLVLEFEDPEEFGYGTGNANTVMFDAVFEGEIGHLMRQQDTWLIAGGTAGLPKGDPSAPWPFSYVVWKNGNEYAKQFISNHHRINAQEPGLAWGWITHMHYKAVKCAEVWPTLEANGLKQSSFKGYLDERDSFMVWNAFSDMKSYHEDFYPNDTCHVGPCPGDGTPPDAVIEDEKSSSFTKESRLLRSSWFRGLW